MALADMEPITKPLYHSKHGVLFLVMFVFWLVLVHEPLFSAIKIWIGNEIYNHCLIVIPASTYLIYERRKELNWSDVTFSRLATFIFILQLVFYILSSAAGIQLFQHVAIFSMLPTMVWMFIGTRLAWQIRFPLFFILFSVPVGEELVPFLQELTADLSVFLLDATGIPLFRSGLFIEIPQGKFLVAEACSGVSFLIASIVLGSLYANMYLVSWKTRVFFVFLSIVFPILANALRVYGIIYIGYATDMEHAVGADHLIYGWFFFAFVLICLFLIGEIIRKREKKWLSSQATEPQSFNQVQIVQADKNASSIYRISNKTITMLYISGLLAILLSIFQIERMAIDTQDINHTISVNTLEYKEIKTTTSISWEPKFVGNNQEKMLHLTSNGFNFDLYFAFFNGTKGELVSSLHRLYNQDRWTLVDRKRMHLNGYDVISELATSSIGIKKEIIYWYWVDGKIVNSFKEAKFIEFVNKLRGVPAQSAIIAVAVNENNSTASKEDELRVVAEQILRANVNLLQNHAVQ